MNEALFLRRNKPDWTRLEEFGRRLEGKGERLSGDDLFAFVSLYRKVAGDLARARTLGLRAEVVDYLNALVGRVHFRVYSAPGYSYGRFFDFFREVFPRTVRRLKGYVAASALLLLLPAVGAYAAVRARPALGTAFTPPGYVELVEENFGKKFGKEERAGGIAAAMTSFYIVNNVQVSFYAFALGFFLGVGSAYILFYNGLILGGVGAVIQEYGLSYNFWSFVSSHGGVELGAIVLAGAAGIRVGTSFLAPGLLTRKAALVAGARDAGLVMCGVVALLVYAAFTEAFVSPSPLPNPAKLALGAVNLSAFLAYLALAGRGPSRPAAAP